MVDGGGVWGLCCVTKVGYVSAILSARNICAINLGHADDDAAQCFHGLLAWMRDFRWL